MFHTAVVDSSAKLAHQQLLLALDSIQQNQCCVDKVVRVYIIQQDISESFWNDLSFYWCLAAKQCRMLNIFWKVWPGISVGQNFSMIFLFWKALNYLELEYMRLHLLKLQAASQSQIRMSFMMTKKVVRFPNPLLGLSSQLENLNTKKVLQKDPFPWTRSIKKTQKL